MRKPLWFEEEISQQYKNKIKQIKQIENIVKESNMLFFVISLIVFAVVISLWDNQTTSYASAYAGESLTETKIILQPVDSDNSFFDMLVKKNVQVGLFDLNATAINDGSNDKVQNLAEKLYEIVGDSPIKEMVPFISQREERVAAFLVGIAKKESSLGFASPSKDGQDCYNYWGYKGLGGNGTSMGYACFASPEEAIDIVGDRIEVLISMNRNTPALMVNTWKCGTSCKGDPGASSWISTVTMYFNKIVG